jgi:hypothetical protein
LPSGQVDDSAEQEYGYFIELPTDCAVTVNGRTFTNAPAPAGEVEQPALPFVIGPLLRFTTIELLSQPVFFFRQRGDMDFTQPVSNSRPNRLPADEIDHRDGNDDVDPANVQITWTPVHSMPASPPI